MAWRKCAFLLLSFYPLFAQETIVFYHIPKCGGTTVASLIGEKFSNDAIYHYRVFKELEFIRGKQLGLLAWHNLQSLALDQIDLKTIRYIHGHMGYRPENEIQNEKNITFLRDPVERVFSAYRYAGMDDSFYDFYPKVSNLQVRYLSGLSPRDPGISLEQHLACAKRNLAEKFTFVGLVEEMSASIEALFTLFRWEPPQITPKFNTTTPDFNPSLYAYVHEREWADRDLYEFAKILFHKQNGPSKPISAAPLFVNAIHFDVTQPIDGEGWGYREFDQETNRLLRQSYISDAVIRFPLLKDDYKIKVVATIPPTIKRKKLCLYVNGKKIDYRRSRNGKLQTLEANISKDSIADNQKTSITFHLDQLYVPSEHEDPLDHRHLGVGIVEIHIEEYAPKTWKEHFAKIFQFALMCR